MAVFYIHRLFYVLPNPLNRITAATDNTQRFGLSNLRYDKNGNITHLTRGGHLKEMPDWDKDDDFGTMDQLDYQYFDGSNRLRSVTDGISKNDTSGKGEFVDDNKDGDDYVYDPNGNMTQDLNKGIKGTTPTEKGIEYNHLNLPTKVSIDAGGANKGTISYIYDATGVKLRKNVLKQGETTPTSTDYVGNYIYENSTLQFFSTPEGYVEPKNPDNLSQGFDYIYQYKDHLGNIRLSYKNAGSTSVDLEIQEENNYYPFGLKHKGYNGKQSAARNHKYGFGGKEEQDELGLGWIDITARNYDPALGRWMNLDPLADVPENYEFSPYNYAINNPILFIDPDGMIWIRIIDKNGNITYTAGDGDSAWSLFDQFGEQDGFTAEDADFIIQHVFGENRVEDGEEFSNIDPEDSFTLLAEGSEIIEKEGERDIRVVPNDSDAEITDLEEVDFGSIQKDQATLKAEDDLKALVITAKLADPFERHSKPLNKVLKGLKSKGIRTTNRITYGSKIKRASTVRNANLKTLKANKIKSQKKIRRKKLKKRLKRNARKKRSGR